jgi:hypothetical protein
LAPELSVDLHEPLEEHEPEHQDQEPSQDRDGLVMGTMLPMVILRQFVEGMVLHPPALMSDAPDRLQGVAGQFLGRQPTPRRVLDLNLRPTAQPPNLAPVQDRY